VTLPPMPIWENVSRFQSFKVVMLLRILELGSHETLKLETLKPGILTVLRRQGCRAQAGHTRGRICFCGRAGDPTRPAQTFLAMWRREQR
jgi:hypothetical protein